MLRNLQSGDDIINLTNDCTPELVANPFTSANWRKDASTFKSPPNRLIELSAQDLPRLPAEKTKIRPQTMAPIRRLLWRLYLSGYRWKEFAHDRQPLLHKAGGVHSRQFFARR
jgi:hypothetical protein